MKHVNQNSYKIRIMTYANLRCAISMKIINKLSLEGSIKFIGDMFSFKYFVSRNQNTITTLIKRDPMIFK